MTSDKRGAGTDAEVGASSVCMLYMSRAPSSEAFGLRQITLFGCIHLSELMCLHALIS